MVYGHRRYRSPRRRTLSTRRIFSNKSARSQASQIYSLNRRVSTLSSRVRPEIKVLQSSILTTVFEEPISGQTEITYTPGGPGLGSGDSNRIGDVIRIISFSCRFSFEYNQADATPVAPGASVRIILAQAKISTAFPSVPELLQYPYTAGVASYLLQTNSPFALGISTQIRICYDRSFKLNAINNQRLIKVSARNFRKHMRFTTAIGGEDANHFIIYIITSGIQATSTDQILMVGSWKMTFTDV